MVQDVVLIIRIGMVCYFFFICHFYMQYFEIYVLVKQCKSNSCCWFDGSNNVSNSWCYAFLRLTHSGHWSFFDTNCTFALLFSQSAIEWILLPPTILSFPSIFGLITFYILAWFLKKSLIFSFLLQLAVVPAVYPHRPHAPPCDVCEFNIFLLYLCIFWK